MFSVFLILYHYRLLFYFRLQYQASIAPPVALESLVPPDVSEYEALRLRNIAANSQFLESLGIPQIKPTAIASKGKFFI